MKKTEARNIYLMLARDVTTDSNDGMNSIIKILDQFRVENESEVHTSTKPNTKSVRIVRAQYTVASSWLLPSPLKKGDQIQLTLSTIDESGEPVISQEHTVEAPTTSPSARVNLNINVSGLPVTHPGEYRLRGVLSRNGKQLASAEYPYEVSFEKGAQEA